MNNDGDTAHPVTSDHNPEQGVRAADYPRGRLHLATAGRRPTAAERAQLLTPYRETRSRAQALFGDRGYDDALLRPRSITWPKADDDATA